MKLNKNLFDKQGYYLIKNAIEPTLLAHTRFRAIELKEEKTPVNGIKGTVMTSKLMGSFSLVHLSVLNNNKEIIHVHSQMPSNFLPKESTAVAIKINTNKIFIFPKNI